MFFHCCKMCVTSMIDWHPHKILKCRTKKAPVLTSISGHVCSIVHLLWQRSPYISPHDVRFEQMVSFTVNTTFSISMLSIWPIQCCASVLNYRSTRLWTMCDPRHLSLSVAEAHVKQLTRVCMHTNTYHNYTQIHINIYVVFRAKVFPILRMFLATSSAGVHLGGAKLNEPKNWPCQNVLIYFAIAIIIITMPHIIML